MKRVLLVLAIVAVLAVPAFSEGRVDLGADVLVAAGLLSGGDLSGVSDSADLLAGHIIPFPEASIYYQWNLGGASLAAGARFFTFILESIFWPNVVLDVAVLDRLIIEGQLGGLLFGLIGISNQISAGQVLIPDLSIWVTLGKQRRFRLGGGALGLMAPEVSGDSMAMLFYLGGKFSLLW